jgi:hypothetical protein
MFPSAPPPGGYLTKKGSFVVVNAAPWPDTRGQLKGGAWRIISVAKNYMIFIY